MSYSSDGSFLPWDPQRACRAYSCAQCRQPNATKRCARCGLAHYCSTYSGQILRICTFLTANQGHCCSEQVRSVSRPTGQRIKSPKKAGVAAYLDAIAGQVRRQAELLKRADVAEAVIAGLDREMSDLTRKEQEERKAIIMEDIDNIIDEMADEETHRTGRVPKRLLRSSSSTSRISAWSTRSISIQRPCCYRSITGRTRVWRIPAAASGQ